MTLDYQRRLKPVTYRFRLAVLALPALAAVVGAWALGVRPAHAEAVVWWVVLTAGLFPVLLASVVAVDAFAATSGCPVPENVPEGLVVSQEAA